MPCTWISSFNGAANIPFRLTNCVSKSRAKSTALFPVTPTRKKMASNYASDNASTPNSSSFSRGRSLAGQSVIAIHYPSFYESLF